MTEDQIERIVQRKMDQIDRRFLTTTMTQDQYDNLVRQLHAWANKQYDTPQALRVNALYDNGLPVLEGEHR